MATSRKPAAKGSPTKRPPAKKTAARRGGSDPRPKSMQDLASKAAGILAELTGRSVEAVVGAEKIDEGLRIQIEVLESRRIPVTADVLGLYEVEIDGAGDLTGYRRVRRYVRGQSSQE